MHTKYSRSVANGLRYGATRGENEARQLVQKMAGGQGWGNALLWEGWNNWVKDSQLVQKEAGSLPERGLHNYLY